MFASVRSRSIAGVGILALVYLIVKSVILPGFTASLGGDGGSYVAAGYRYVTEGDVFDVKRPPLYPLILAWLNGSDAGSEVDSPSRSSFRSASCSRS